MERKRFVVIMMLLLLFLGMITAPALAKYESEVVAVISGQGTEGVNVSNDKHFF